MKQWLLIILSAILLFSCVGTVQAEPVLTMDRAIMINDTQVVMEFSEPVAINLHGNNDGPFAAIRLVNNKNFLQKSTDGQDLYLQWLGTLEYLDDKKDRLLFTIGFSRLGANAVADVYSFKGELAEYRDLYCCMCLEEKPYDVFTPAYNGLIENVTSLDGKRQLCANTAMSADGIYLRLEKDYEYDYDPSLVMSLKERAVSVSIEAGTGQEISVKIKNDPLIVWGIIGGCLILAVLVSAVVVVIRKKEERS